MSSTNVNEEKKKYEKEFLDFLLQKIQHAGGSLQFQHLSGQLQQVRFEIRETWGTSKCELMKFLRTHPNKFKVDGKGIVTIVDTPKLEDCESIVIKDENMYLKSRNSLPLEIKNGKGSVKKISPEFGLIFIEKPSISKYVYFTPENYCNDKESLFIDHNLNVNTEVDFNAIYSYDDQDDLHDNEILYRATKVWKRHDKNSRLEDCKKNINKLSHEDKTVVCDKDNFKVNKDPNFSKNIVKDVKKSMKDYTKSPSHSEASKKDSVKKNELVNHRGKIFPYRHGAVIKFGKDDSETAEGDTCDYFLYGSKVSDINWEFSEGDNIFFDAIPIKTHPYWKAVLVWIGEKPTNSIKRKTYVKENEQNNKDQISESASDVSTESCHTLSKSDLSKSKNLGPETVEKKSNISPDHCMSKKDLQSNVKFKHSNLEISKNSFTEIPLNKVRTRKEEFKSKKKIFFRNKNKDYNQESATELTESSSSEDNKSVFSSMMPMKRNQKISDNKFTHGMHNSKDFQKQKYECSASTKIFKFKSSSEEENDEGSDEGSYIPKPETVDNNVESSIRIFEDIEGEVTRLLCKAAFLRSPHLPKEVDFMINTFYLDGRSIEDQHVIDLKEVLKVGDYVKFNCFVIIDNIGEIYQKVTMAWKGRRPENIREMTPQEFIVEYDLSVSEVLSQNKIENINSDYAHINYMSEDNNDTTDSDNYITEEADNENNNYASDNVNDATENEKANNILDAHYISEDDGLEHHSESMIKINERDTLTQNSDYKLLSEKIIQALKNSGCISSDPKVDLINVINEVSSLLKKSTIKDQEGPSKSRYSSDYSDIVCSECSQRPKSRTGKKTNDAEAQTIITGDIVATSIYTQN